MMSSPQQQQTPKYDSSSSSAAAAAAATTSNVTTSNNHEDMSSTIASEVLAACIGGAVSASVLYPLEVLKTKMQAVNKTAAAASGDGGNATAVIAEELEESSDEDGFVAADSSSSPDTKRKDNNDKKTSTTQKKQQQQQEKQQAAAAEDKDEHELSMIPFARKLYAEQGASVFVRGVETSAFQSAAEKSLYFFAYTALKHAYSRLTGGRPLDAVSNLALGCAAEWAHLPVTLPIDAWTTAIQTQDPAGKHQTPMKILLRMLSDDSVSFYKGVSAYVLLCFKPAIQYTVYEQVKRAVVAGRRNKTLSAAEAFLLGMVARTVATVAVFPFLRAKVLLQTQQQQQKQQKQQTAAGTKDAPEERQKKKNNSGILSLLWEQFSTAGISGLYHGLGPELTRGVFSAALMLMIKERIAVTVKQAVMLVLDNNGKGRHGAGGAGGTMIRRKQQQQHRRGGVYQ